MTENKSSTEKRDYAARLDMDYPVKLNRGTTFFRMLWIIPIAIILGLVTGAGETVTNTVVLNEAGEVIRRTRDTAGGMALGISTAVGLMILFRQVYPKWWFNFLYELNKFELRVAAYAALMTDVYPSTTDEQSVHLELDYPDAKTDLNRWMPLFKWFLAIPHYVVLFFLSIAAGFSVIIAWFAILFTGKYPQVLFNYNLGVLRWWTRVNAYVALLITDEYPPFSLN